MITTAPRPAGLVVFDLDGTLVDSQRDIAAAANAVLESCGAAALPIESVARMVGEGAATLVARVFAAAGIEAPPDALARWMAVYDRVLLDETVPYDGVIDTLEALRGRVPLAVLTNKPLEPTRRILDGLGLAPFFNPASVLGGDGPMPRKPDPAGLHALMRAHGVTPDATVMVGDSVIDFRTAEAAGTRCALATYGFGFRMFPAGVPTGSACLLDCARDLPRYVWAGTSSASTSTTSPS